MSFYLVEDSNNYIWEINVEHYFKGCDNIDLLTKSINRYLKICLDSELEEILNRKYFLRINCYEFENKSRIKIQNLIFDGLNDINYRKLLESRPSSNMLTCELYLGPYWHFLGIYQEMVKNRQIHLGYLLPNGYIMGSILYGRDKYYGENEKQIQEVEKVDNIFIIRN